MANALDLGFFSAFSIGFIRGPALPPVSAHACKEAMVFPVFSTGSVPSWYHREIGLGDYGADVNIVRRKLGFPPGQYTREVSRLITGLCSRHGIAVLEEVTPEVAVLLGETEAASAGLTPEWYVREIGPGDTGHDVSSLRQILGLPAGDVFDRACDNAVRRFQSGCGVNPTGRVDDDLARLLGDL